VIGLLSATTAWAEMVTVVVDKANFRESPSTKSAILYTADRFYTVEVIERKDDWVKTRDFEGDVAWVAAHLVEPKDSVVVHVPSALIRKGPSKNTDIVFKAERGEGLAVGRRQDPWIQVTNIDGVTGWVHRDVVWAGTKE